MTEQLPSERRPTRQRAAIALALAGSSEFRSAQEIHADLVGSGTRVGLATVYRNLQAMAGDGEVDVIRTTEGEAVYRSCSTDHHHHVVCRSCGAAKDIDCVVGAAPCLTPDDAGEFVIDEAEVTFWGLCPACQTAQQVA